MGGQLVKKYMEEKITQKGFWSVAMSWRKFVMNVLVVQRKSTVFLLLTPINLFSLR